MCAAFGDSTGELGGRAGPLPLLTSGRLPSNWLATDRKGRERHFYEKGVVNETSPMAEGLQDEGYSARVVSMDGYQKLGCHP